MSARRFWSWGSLFAGLAAGGNSIEEAPPLHRITNVVPSHLCRIASDDVELIRMSHPSHHLPVRSTPGRGVPYVIVDAPPSDRARVHSIPGRGLWYFIEEPFEPVLPEPRSRRRRLIDAHVRVSEWTRLIAALKSDSALPNNDATQENSDAEGVRG